MLHLASCFCGQGIFAEIVKRRKIALGFVLWIYLPLVESDVFGTGAEKRLFKKIMQLSTRLSLKNLHTNFDS